MELLLLFLAIEIIGGLFTFNFYKAAGRQAWEAFVPVYRIVVLMKIIERPWWWTILCYIPVVGNVMAVVVVYELLHVFRFNKLWHTLLSIATFGLYLGYLNFTAKLEYIGRDIKEIRRHVSELAASLIFAIVAATIIRTFTFEAFTIPTPSMEKSLMVGDFLFVSKMHYGTRMPMTPLAIPLVHNHIPFSKTTNSYLEWIKLPYWRFPKIQEVERGDAVVFNYPAEDIRYAQFGMEGEDRPIDKREHYVKRNVALPGDTMEIINGQVFIDGEMEELPSWADPQRSYYVRTNGLEFNPKLLKQKFDINFNNSTGDVMKVSAKEYIITISKSQLEAFENLENVTSVEPLKGAGAGRGENDTISSIGLRNIYNVLPSSMVSQDIFPNPKMNLDGSNRISLNKLPFKWSRDNYGPLWLPKKGETMEFTPKNFLKYERAITAYEDHELEFKNGKYLLDGQAVTDYTFEKDYYFMMGDNRHASDDSRYWGFVPDDHIVGKPVFIWMSWDKYAEGFNKIRKDRVFTVVHTDGPRKTYFLHVAIVALLIYFGNQFYQKRKKAKEAA